MDTSLLSILPSTSFPACPLTVVCGVWGIFEYESSWEKVKTWEWDFGTAHVYLFINVITTITKDRKEGKCTTFLSVSSSVNGLRPLPSTTAIFASPRFFLTYSAASFTLSKYSSVYEWDQIRSKYKKTKLPNNSHFSRPLILILLFQARKSTLKKRKHNRSITEHRLDRKPRDRPEWRDRL